MFRVPLHVDLSLRDQPDKTKPTEQTVPDHVIDGNQVPDIDPPGRRLDADLQVNTPLDREYTGLVRDRLGPHNRERLVNGLFNLDFAKGNLRLDAQGQIDEALSAYTQAFTLHPGDAAALSSAAYLLRVRGQIHAALVLEARALDAGPPTLYGPLQIAVCLELIHHPAAEIWWERALTEGAGTSVILAERMMADLRAGRPANALDRYQASAPGLQTTPRLQSLAGLAYWQLGETDRARRVFERAGDAAQPELAALNAIDGHSALSTQDWLNDAMSEGASWPDLRIRLAGVEARAGRTGRALELVGTAIDLGWRDADILETSPLLAPLVASDAWPALRGRIEREIAAQRRLVLASQALDAILGRPGGTE